MELDKAKLKAIKQSSLDGEIHLPLCPPEFRGVAERIMVMLDREPFNDAYTTMTELDKKLVLRYWNEYDKLNDALADIRDGKGSWQITFGEWFLFHATNPDTISRARRYLVSDAKLLIIPPTIARHAKQADDKWAKSVYAHGSG
jgi:orotidine-5'-phosphate decarboxylase